jgi:hypothetical protein
MHKFLYIIFCVEDVNTLLPRYKTLSCEESHTAKLFTKCTLEKQEVMLDTTIREIKIKLN